MLLVHHIVSFLQLKFIYDYSFPPASFPSGESSAVNMKSVCPKEMVTLYCPVLKQAIRSGDYKKLHWEVFDPRNKTQHKQHVGVCDKYLNCDRYVSLGIYAKRITIRGNLVKGVLHVEQLIQNDLLTFVCQVKTKRPFQYPHVYEVNISSITCKYYFKDYLIYVSVLAVSFQPEFSFNFYFCLLVYVLTCSAWLDSRQ